MGGLVLDRARMGALGRLLALYFAGAVTTALTVLLVIAVLLMASGVLEW